jgi:hypothetical protein
MLHVAQNLIVSDHAPFPEEETEVKVGSLAVLVAVKGLLQISLGLIDVPFHILLGTEVIYVQVADDSPLVEDAWSQFLLVNHLRLVQLFNHLELIMNLVVVGIGSRSYLGDFSQNLVRVDVFETWALVVGTMELSDDLEELHDFGLLAPGHRYLVKHDLLFGGHTLLELGFVHGEVKLASTAFPLVDLSTH